VSLKRGAVRRFSCTASNARPRSNGDGPEACRPAVG
jgi:hypothetical protein